MLPPACAGLHGAVFLYDSYDELRSVEPGCSRTMGRDTVMHDPASSELSTRKPYGFGGISEFCTSAQNNKLRIRQEFFEDVDQIKAGNRWHKRISYK